MIGYEAEGYRACLFSGCSQSRESDGQQSASGAAVDADVPEDHEHNQKTAYQKKLIVRRRVTLC